MEVGRVGIGRLSTSGRSEAESLCTTPERGKHILKSNEEQQNHKKQHPKNRIVKMFNKVQVVYYLTRNAQLQHPHYLEVSHLATQPLRLKDVIDRLAVLRGKAMPCQYSWSCKRSYKNGYVWNDLTENDPIYASDGSEYVLKGSELLHERDFSSEIRLEELQIKQRQEKKVGCHTKTNGLEKNKLVGIHPEHYHRQQVFKNYQQNMINKNNEEAEEEEEEEKGSCNSSNAPYSTLQIDQEESYSLPSTSSTNSDKQPPPPPPPPKPPMQQPQATKSSSEQSRRLQKETSRTFIEEDGDPTFTTSLTRNSAILLHLIACGGGGIVGNTNTQERRKSISNNCVGSSRNFNFSMKNKSFMPCLKQQLSTRPSKNDSNAVKSVIESCSRESKAGNGDDDHVIGRIEDDDDDDDDDEDMIMVRYMSENPRFGNLQSEEKEYFSGTIVETMATQQTHHQHKHSSGSATYPYSQTPVFTKSSSYNEQRSVKAGLGAAVVSTMSDEEDEKEDSKVKGIIKLCIPRKKSSSTRQT